MSGGRKAAYLTAYMTICTLMVVFADPEVPIIGFLGVTGFFGGIIVILLTIQGAAIGRTTRNIRKEWDK